MSLEGKSPEEIEALAQLADSALSNSKTRGVFQRILKAVNPNLSIPEVELEDRLAAAVKPHAEAVQKLTQERERDTQVQQANTLYETLHDDGVVAGRKDFNEIVKYAAEKGFMTNEQGLRMASQHRAAELESAEPSSRPMDMTMILQKNNKDLMKNPAEWARAEAARAMDDLAKQRKAGGARILN